MPAVLDREVTHVTQEVTVQGCLVPTVFSAFRAANVSIMSRNTRHRLRRDAEFSAYFRIHGFYPKNRAEVKELGWAWYVGDYNVSTGQYETLSYDGSKTKEVPADPIFVAMTAKLDQELAKVPDISYSFVVESFWTDPIGCVVITSGDTTRKYRYYAWDGNRTLWPPSRG